MEIRCNSRKIFVALIKKPKPSILPCRSTKIKPLLDQPFFKSDNEGISNSLEMFYICKYFGRSPSNEIMLFLLSDFSFTNIHDSYDSSRSGRLSL